MPRGGSDETALVDRPARRRSRASRLRPTDLPSRHPDADPADGSEGAAGPVPAGDACQARLPAGRESHLRIGRRARRQRQAARARGGPEEPRRRRGGDHRLPDDDGGPAGRPSDRGRAGRGRSGRHQDGREPRPSRRQRDRHLRCRHHAVDQAAVAAQGAAARDEEGGDAVEPRRSRHVAALQGIGRRRARDGHLGAGAGRARAGRFRGRVRGDEARAARRHPDGLRCAHHAEPQARSSTTPQPIACRRSTSSSCWCARAG